MLKILIIVAFIIALVEATTIPLECHSDCVPYMCHGSSQLNCDECRDNMALKYNRCECKVGYFSVNGLCEYHLPHCISIGMVSGVLKCLKCETSRDTLANGQCTRNTLIPFFKRDDGLPYTGTADDLNDFDIFYIESCKTMDETGLCKDCPDDRILDPNTGGCQILNPDCASYDSSNSCTRARLGYFLDPNNFMATTPCFAFCGSCFDSSYYGCLSCMPGYYYEYLPDKKLGVCKQCDSICETCFGGGPDNCSTTQQKKYIDRDDLVSPNTVKNCATGCDHCLSNTNCLNCANEKISVDGICGSTSTTIPKCRYQYNTGGVPKCLGYGYEMITGTDGKPYPIPLAYMNIIELCLVFNTADSTRISVECARGTLQNRLIEYGLCKEPPATGILNCYVLNKLTSNQSACVKCSNNKFIQNEECVDVCDANSGSLVLYGFNYCSECSVGCQQCAVSSSVLECQVCQTTPIKFELFKGLCSSTTCGDSIVSLNKECDPGIPGQATTCTSDCLLKDPVECPSDGCSRKIFEVVSIGEKTLQFRVKSRYSDFVEYSIKADLFYDSSNPASMMFFCSLLFEDIQDTETTCSFNLLLQTVTISTSYSTFLKLSKVSATNILTASLTYKRRFLTVLSFVLHKEASVSIDEWHKPSSCLITTSGIQSSTTDLSLEYMLHRPSPTAVVSTVWQLLSFKENGVENSEITTTFNGQLSGSSPKILKSQLVSTSQLVLTVKVTVSFADGSSDTAEKEITVSQKPPFIQSRKQLFIYDPAVKVNILIDVLTAELVSTSIAVTSSDSAVLPSHFNSVIFKNSHKLLLKFQPPSAASSSFTVRLTHMSGDHADLELIFIKAEQPPHVNVIVPKTFNINSLPWYWVSSGAEVTVKSFIFETGSLNKLQQTVFEPANYKMTLPSPLTTLGDKLLILIVRKASDSKDYFYTNIFGVATGLPSHRTDIPIGTTFRDGSSLHSSADTIQIGMSRNDFILNANPTSMAANIEAVVTGVRSKLQTTLASANLKNKLEITPSCRNAGADFGSKISTEFGYFTKESSELMNYRCIFHYFNPISVQLLVTELTTSEPTTHAFGVQSTTAAVFNDYNHKDEYQFEFKIKLHNRRRSSKPLMPIVIAGKACFDELKLESFILSNEFNLVNDVAHAVEVEVFDHNGWVASPTQALPVATLKQTLSVEDYIAQHKAKAITDDYERLVDWNLASYHLTQVYLNCGNSTSCKHAKLCEYGAELADQFTAASFDTEDSVIAVLANSFIQSLSTNPFVLGDSQIDALATNVETQIKALFDFSNLQRASVSRTDYQLIERLKPRGSITLTNVDLLLSSTSHLLQLYTKKYSGFQQAEEVKDRLNHFYKLLLGMNELKLLRYCHVSDTIHTRNEVVKVGGATLVSPLQSKYLFHFGSDLSVEINYIDFNETKDFYELSVVMFSDDYYDMLAERLKSFNLTTALQKSRTSVGFTNSFGLVSPKVSEKTEVNIYRRLEDCRGQPCDANRKVNNGQEVILCECLNASQLNTFTDKPPASLGTQTTDVLMNTSKTIKETFKRSISFDVRKFDDKNAWFSSVVLIFLVLLVSAVMGCVLEKKWIIPRSKLNFRRNSIKLAIDQKLREMKHHRHSNKLSMPRSTDIQQTAALNTGSDSSGSDKPRKNDHLNSDQSRIIEDLVALLKKDPLSNMALEGMRKEKLSFWGLFKVIYLTHHFCWGLFNGLSSKYSKATLIANILTHFVYVLALTMALGFGWDKSSFTGYQMFIFKCLVSPILVGFLGFVTKMLSKHEADYGMSFLNWCPRKNSSEADSPRSVLREAPEVPEERPTLKNKSTVYPTNNSKSLVNNSTEPVSKHNARSYPKKATRSEQPLHLTDEVVSPTSPAHSDCNKFKWIELEKTVPPKTLRRRLMIIGSYLLTIVFVPLSFMSIYQTVAAMEENNKEWPFGMWFLIQFAYEMSFGKTLHCLFQLALFKIHLRLRHRSKLNRLESFNRSFCSFMLNSDIKDLMDINDSIHRMS